MRRHESSNQERQGGHITRRRALASLGIVAAGFSASRGSLARADAPASEPVKPEQALERLIAGNRRFVEGKSTHRYSEESRRPLRTQHPFAVIVGCSDSRVPPELIFDQGLGDLFVARVAGNVTVPAVIASSEYAVYHLRSPLIVILGHEHCGAVTAALEGMGAESREPGAIPALLGEIEMGLKGLSTGLRGNERIHAAVEANVRFATRKLVDVPELKALQGQGKIKIVGAVYDLETWSVRWLQ